MFELKKFMLVQDNKSQLLEQIQESDLSSPVKLKTSQQEKTTKQSHL